MDKDQPYLPILQAVKILVTFWEVVKQEMVMSCFKKADITSEAQCAAITDSDNSIKEVQKSLYPLKATDPNMVPEGLSNENVINVGRDRKMTSGGEYDVMEKIEKFCNVKGIPFKKESNNSEV